MKDCRRKTSIVTVAVIFILKELPKNITSFSYYGTQYQSFKRHPTNEQTLKITDRHLKLSA